MEQDREPKPGDLIEFFRAGYQHWAVYVGDGYVIHLVKNGPSGKTTAMKERLQDVAGSDRYRVNNQMDRRFTPQPPSFILRDAESFLGRELTYNVVKSNCEHLAMEIRYGEPYSQQVKLAEAKIARFTEAASFGVI